MEREKRGVRSWRRGKKRKREGKETEKRKQGKREKKNMEIWRWIRRKERKGDNVIIVRKRKFYSPCSRSLVFIGGGVWKIGLEFYLELLAGPGLDAYWW